MSSPGRLSPRGIITRVPTWLDRNKQEEERFGDPSQGSCTVERDMDNFRSLKDQGCTVTEEEYKVLCKIRNAMHEDKSKNRVAMVEDGMKDFDKAWSRLDFDSKRLLVRDPKSRWGTLNDEMNMFVGSNKTRS